MTPNTPLTAQLPDPDPIATLIAEFSARTGLAESTIWQIVRDNGRISPEAVKEALDALQASINRGLVLHSTAAKGIPRAKLREHNKTRKQITGPSKLRTAKEKKQAAAKLKEHRRKAAG